MLLTVTPIAFWIGNARSYTDVDGRMMWRVASSVGFAVTRNPGDGEEATWQCECPRGMVNGPTKITPAVCDHIQEAYLYWLNGENRKRKMMEELLAHREQTKLTKPTEEPITFVVNPKRRINLDE